MNIASRSWKLVLGSACLALFCPPAMLFAVTIAADDASNPAYADGWQAGDDGGTGFGPWAFAFSGTNSGLFHDPQFIDNAPLAGNSLGAPAFALTTSDRRFFTDTSEVLRSFDMPLSVGQTFTVDVDGSALDPSATPFSTGNTFQLFGSDGLERFGLFTNNQYHNNNWTATGDVNTGIPAASAFHIDFTLVTPNTYNLALLPIGGGAALFTQTGAPLEGTAGAAINSLRISDYGTGSSANGSKELFFDNLMVASLGGPDADYNNNGTVDAADYVVWRDTLGQTGAGLAADGNGNNRIDEGDYDVWKAQFNSSVPTSSSIGQLVPEPAAWLTSMVGIGCLVVFPVVCRRRHGMLSRSTNMPTPAVKDCCFA